jgi:putative ABC transport system permease protein
MNTFTLGVRNAFRNTTRSFSITLILGLSIGLSLMMLIAHQAVGQKIGDVKRAVGNTITITPAGFSNFSQANNALTVSDLTKVTSLAHVAQFTESLSDHLSTTGSSSFGAEENGGTTSLKSPVKIGGNGKGGGIMMRSEGKTLPANFTPPLEVLGTTDPGQLNDASLTTKSGTSIDGGKDANKALISSAMATENNLKVGSTFTAYSTPFKVVGIFDTSSQSGENTIVMSLPTVQRLSGQVGDVTNAVATVDSIDNLSSTTSAVKSALGSNADVQSSQDEADNTVKPLENIQNVSLYSLAGAVVAGSVVILLTMIMIVRERRREIGILKAIGASNVRIIFQFMSEALTLTILGAAIGFLIGVIGGGPVTNTLVSNANNSDTPTNNMRSESISSGRPEMSREGSFMPKRTLGISRVGDSLRDIHATIGWSALGYGLGAALVISAVGSASAGWLIARVRPSEVMRAE